MSIAGCGSGARGAAFYLSGKSTSERRRTHMTGRRAISAWVVYWDWIGENAEVRDRVVCLLPPRWEPARVAPVVETLYASTHYTLAEFASHVRRRDANPYPAEVTESARVICGHNPFLVAVKVKSLRVSTDPRTRLYS